MSSCAFPSVASMAASSHISRTSGNRLSAESAAQFSERARKLNSKLSDRAACVLLVLHHSPSGADFKSIEFAIASKQGTLRVVLGALFDLGLITASGNNAPDWMRVVSITDAGEKLVAEASRND